MSNGARWPLNGHHSITRSLAGSMTRKTVTVSFLLIILNLTSLVTYIEAQAPSGPRLVILPNEAVIRRPVNKAFVVTCKGDNAEPSLFTDLKWLDANGDEINSNYQNQKIRVSKESERLLLTFYDPTSNDGGQYVCSGTFQESELLKRAVDVSFYQDITFEDCPDSQSLVKGSSGVVIRCSVFANPPPIITWTKNGAGLSQGTQGQKYIIENNGIQVKGTVSEDDAGRYDVSARVEDTGAVEYRFITVEVHVAPEIREVKQDKNATEGEEVTLTCHATGVPAPQYTWFDPQRRNLSTVGGYQVDRDRGTVSIMKVKRLEDNGKFTCEASNAAGKIQYEYKVDVITRPVITSFENTTAIVGSDGSLECRATGLPAPELTIRKDGEEEALFNGKNGAKLDLGTKDDETILKVTLSPTSRAHDGLYYCSASNLGGRADRVGHLTVHFKPDLSQTKLDVKTWDAQPANLLCNVAAIPNATVNWWFRGNEIYADNSNPTYRVTGTNDGSVLHVRPHGTPGAGGADVYGNYRCIARNVLGESMVEIKLGQASRPEPPGPVMSLGNTATTMSFSVGYPVNDGGLPVRKIVCTFREETSSDERVVSWPYSSGDGPYKLENLTPRQSYLVRFAAENEVGLGDYTSESRYVMPYESAPEKVPITLQDSVILPESGDVMSPSSREYLLQWREPVDNGRPIQEYKLKFYRVVRSDEGWRQVGTEKTEVLKDRNQFFYYRIQGLDSDSFYKLELSANNAKGDSEPAYLVFKTAKGDPRSEKHTNGASGLTAAIFLIILALIVLLVIVDLVFYVRYRSGALFYLKNEFCASSKNLNDDAKEKQQMNANAAVANSNGTEV